MSTELSRQEKLKRVVDRISGLPTLPTILTSINKLMLNPRTSAKEVAQLISNDPAITSKILRVVNSSFYGFPNRITTITHAIVILGFNTIKSIVLSSSIFDVFKKGGESSFDRVEFWRHSIAVGVAAKILAKRIGHSGTEEFFIAGLLHDVGKVVADQFLHEDFLHILERVRQHDMLIVRAEEDVLGVTHSDIGAWLFQRWNLSRTLVDCTWFHHNPVLASENPRAVAVVHLADILVRSMGIGNGGDRRIPPMSDTAWQTLDIPVHHLDKIMAETDEEMERASVFLNFVT